MAVIPIKITTEDKIAIIAPHPDDECIGAGGIIALYPKQCDIFVMTDGSQGQKNVSPEEERKIRKYQFQREMEYAGVHNYFWLGYEDGALLGKKSCMDKIDFSTYTKIFLPWGNDNHPDHTAAYVYAIEKIRQQELNDVEIYQYEVHVPFHDVTNYVDITDVIEKKKYLIQFHEDQLEGMCYDETAVSLAKYRACQANQPQQYHETFVKVNLDIHNNLRNIEEREYQIQKYRQFYRLFIRWIRVEQKRKSIANYLVENDIKKISIYGYGDIGKLLCDELSGSRVQIQQILDKRELKSNQKGIMVKRPENGNRDTVVIVTAICDYDQIKKELDDLGYIDSMSLQNIVEEIENGVS